MKKFIVVIIVFAISALFLQADIYIKEKFHADASYHHGTNNPAVDRESEIWIGDNKIATINPRVKMVLDKAAKKMLLVNLTAKTYFEFTLPVDPAKIRDQQLAGMVQIYKFHFDVQPTDKKQTLKKWKCKAFNMKSWIQQGENIFNETENTLWVTSDVPFDISLGEDLNKNLLKIIVDDENMLAQFSKTKGYPVLIETSRFAEGQEFKSRREVVEIVKKDPPKGIYSVPEGFTKKEAVGVPDVRVFLNN